MKKHKELYAEFTISFFQENNNDSSSSKIIIETEEKRADIFSRGLGPPFTSEIVILPKELKDEILPRLSNSISSELSISISKFLSYCSYRLALLSNKKKEISRLENIFEILYGEPISYYDCDKLEIRSSASKRGPKSKKPGDWTLIEFARTYKEQLSFLESLEKQYKEFYNSLKGSQAIKRKQACDQLEELYKKSEPLPQDIITWVKNKPIRPSYKALELAANIRGISSQSIRTLLKWKKEGELLFAREQQLISELNLPDITEIK